MVCFHCSTHYLKSNNKIEKAGNNWALSRFGPSKHYEQPHFLPFFQHLHKMNSSYLHSLLYGQTPDPLTLLALWCLSVQMKHGSNETGAIMLNTSTFWLFFSAQKCDHCSGHLRLKSELTWMSLSRDWQTMVHGPHLVHMPILVNQVAQKHSHTYWFKYSLWLLL